MAEKTKAAVIGCGSWGTALAHHLAVAGCDVVLSGNEPDVLKAVAEKHENAKYFPGEILHPELKTSDDQLVAARGAQLVVFAVPSFAMRSCASVIKRVLEKKACVVSVAKGLESASLKTMSQVLLEELPQGQPVAVLSGPSFALEVLRGLPTAVTVAAHTHDTARKAGKFFHYAYFRVYTSTDVVGVELGGAIKNVIAVAAGVVDGLGMGNNARAALITRGIVEMQRIILACGGDARTVAGLSGLGDLLLTATGDLSRNRRVGLGLGRGEKLSDIVSRLGQVAEAVETTGKALELARRHNIQAPIIEQIDAIIAGRATPGEAVKNLLSREQRAENEDFVLDLLGKCWAE
ncbi:MAG TPA: NAD(P)H-dependent glycerol-3-phosphate dehydrogenase [Oligoflexia bacterium]|nr:NAD(P)H-dependent glycerol-3-phosphate dehydrogenase [Oligoflexia bacterium]